jgi:tetratricopeptide (TPR) repeat protein
MMKTWQRITLSCLYLITLILFTFPPVKAYAAPAESATGVGSAEKDRETLDEFDRKSPGKLQAMDGKLAEALIMYYDGRYGQALPIFNEIASQVETTDIMWWVGTSAMNSGNLDLAVRKFQQMLSVDPKLHRVRLELAAAYFQMGKYKEAGQELATVKAADPPEEVRANIEKLLATIDEAGKKLRWNVRASLGVQWDDNVSAGPDNRIINIGSGTLTLAQTSAKVSDTGYTTNIGGNILYSFGEKQLGLSWNTDLNYFSVLYNKYSQFNYAMIDAATGPWWVARNFIVKFPVGYTIQYFGDSDLVHMTTTQRDNQNQGRLTPGEFLKTNGSLAQDNSLTRLSYITHLDPNVEYFFNQYFSLKGTFSYSRETFSPKWSQDTASWDNQNQFDNLVRRYEINPNIYLFNRRHVLSFTGGYGTTMADARINTNDFRYYSASYFMRFPAKTEVFLKFQKSFTDYKDKPPLYNDYRYDTKEIYTAVVSQNFLKHFYASLAFNFIRNDSNADIYTFDKKAYTFSIGAYF